MLHITTGMSPIATPNRSSRSCGHRIRVQIEIAERVSVRESGTPQYESIRRIFRSENDYVSLPVIFQREPPGKEGVHDDVTEFGIFADESPQISGTQLEQGHRLQQPGSDRWSAGGNHEQFSGKLARSIRRDNSLFFAAYCDDSYRTGDDDVDGRSIEAWLVENFARDDLPWFCVDADAVDLGFSQMRARKPYILLSWGRMLVMASTYRLIQLL